MASVNRGRYEVALGDGWKAFSDRVPGCEMLGTIVVGGVEGALIRYASDDSYALVRPGRVSTLVARKVEAAMESRRAA